MDNDEAIRVLQSLIALAGKDLATTIDDVDAQALDLAIAALRAPKYVAARMDSDPDPSLNGFTVSCEPIVFRLPDGYRSDPDPSLTSHGYRIPRGDLRGANGE